MKEKYLLALGLLGLSITSLAQVPVDHASGSESLVKQAVVQQNAQQNTAPRMQNVADLWDIEQQHARQLQDTELALQARQKIQVFATTLKQALVGAIQNGGLVHAVDVCHTVAPEIASSLSDDDWQVGRTSLKVRNTNNQPDVWESTVLTHFDNEYKAGVALNKLNVAVQEPGMFRYMQAIPTDQMCLACHGAAVDPALLKAITTQYPNDAATGFTLDDLRGAFTISKQLAKDQ